MAKEQNVKVYSLIDENCTGLNLCDGIRTCPQVEVHLKLCDEVPFFVCPYLMKEEQNQVIEKVMYCLKKLGILRKRPTGIVLLFVQSITDF